MEFLAAVYFRGEIFLEIPFQRVPALDRAGLRHVPLTMDLYGHWFPPTDQKYENGRDNIVFGLDNQTPESSNVATPI